jgi:hypothetical protein
MTLLLDPAHLLFNPSKVTTQQSTQQSTQESPDEYDVFGVDVVRLNWTPNPGSCHRDK